MIKSLLAFLLLFSALSYPSDRADANGATVVFLQVRASDYLITAASYDKSFTTSKLFDVFESSTDGLLIARIDPFLYRWITYYTSAGDDVSLKFQGYEEVVFRYYPSVRAILGVTSSDEVIVLLSEPATASQTTKDALKSN
jgi:hypothetical protein